VPTKMMETVVTDWNYGLHRSKNMLVRNRWLVLYCLDLSALSHSLAGPPFLHRSLTRRCRKRSLTLTG
jgi:hypothetical protein